MRYPLNKTIRSFAAAIGLMVGLGVLVTVIATLLGVSPASVWENGRLFAAYLFVYWVATIGVTQRMFEYCPQSVYLLIPLGSGLGALMIYEHGFPVNMTLPLLLCYLTGCIWWMLSERERHPYRPAPLV